ncbi:MAG TPA: TIGR00180 family glycosyltransferase [Pseudolabrys sp.]|nr:TIGR00180 family glycosyltransferase [Pseudolabrys sp.]
MQPDNLLTVLVPTRNRPHNLAGQLALFAKAGLKLIVADSSDPDKAEEVRSICKGVDVWTYAPDTGFFDKLADAASRIETPFVQLAADRKITFPHAIKAALDVMRKREEYVCAQGYVLGFGVHDDDIDINRVVFFTPSIEEPDPLWRQYHLMRRYQSWQFSLFRLEPLRRAIAQTNTVTGVMFQEVMFMNAIAVQGKLARLPNIMTLQTVEESFSRLRDIDPFYWFLHDSRSFFRHYVRYRNSLARFIWNNGTTGLALAEVHHVLDAVHAVWLRYNFDPGVLNLATQQLLDAKELDLPHPRPVPPWRKKKFRDVAHSRPKKGRYLWRRSVLKAEPREEIKISREDIKRVEAQLDVVFDV